MSLKAPRPWILACQPDPQALAAENPGEVVVVVVCVWARGQTHNQDMSRVQGGPVNQDHVTRQEGKTPEGQETQNPQRSTPPSPSMKPECQK